MADGRSREAGMGRFGSGRLSPVDACGPSGHTANVQSVCLSPDGLWALSGSDDKTLRLWEVATGKCVRVFEGHTSSVLSSYLSFDGRCALSGSGDGALRLWEVETGTCVWSLEGHMGAVGSVFLSYDGRWALSGGDDKTLRLWELDWELEGREFVDWDEGARPYIEKFLTVHTPYAAPLPLDHEPSQQELESALTRRGKPKWSEKDFKNLLYILGCAGYGWLRPEGVCRGLERMANEWHGPPPPPWGK